MNRRELLKKAGFLTTSVAMFGLAGCNENDTDPVNLPFLKKYRFPQGVMAADPKPDSIILWTRVVAPNDDDIKEVPSTRANVKVMLEVSMTEAFTDALATPVTLVAQAKYDNTIRHKLTGLNPATTYYYRFRAEAGVSRVGRFKTAPALNADVAALNFAFMACQDWSVNHWIGLSALVTHNLDFVVHLGDYIYEAAGDSYQSEKVEGLHTKIIMPSNSRKPNNPEAQIAVTTEDYRYLYKKYRSDERL